MPLIQKSRAANKIRQDKYIAPKRAYSLEAMLDDILEFAALSLIDNGRLSLWMPTANDEEKHLDIPKHPALESIAVCVQVFNKCMFKSSPSSLTRPDPTLTSEQGQGDFSRIEGYQTPK